MMFISYSTCPKLSIFLRNLSPSRCYQAKCYAQQVRNFGIGGHCNVSWCISKQLIPARHNIRVHSKVFSFIVRKCSQKASNVKTVKLAHELATNSGKSNVKRLLSLAKPEKWKLIGAVGFLLVSSTVTMAVPFALGKVIDTIYTDDSEKMRENLNTLVATLLGVFLVGGACNFGRVYFMSIAGVRITQALRQRVFGSILKQEVAFFDKNKTGELINRLSADTTLVSQAVTMNISDGLRSTVMVTAGVSMMFYMSPALATVGLLVVPPVAAMAVIYGRFVKKITTNVQDSLASATSVAQERIGNIRTVKAFSKEDLEMSNYSEKLNYVLRLQYKESLARGVFFGLTGLSGNVIILSVLYYGGVMVSSQTLTVGNLSSFLLYAAYIGVSIGGLSSFYSELNKGLGASTRLWQIIDRTPKLNPGGMQLSDNLLGTISLKDVTFTYPTRPEAPVLDGLSLEIPAGSVTAIVGASGSGKSSIAAVLLRLYDPDNGAITLDNIPIKDLDPESLHRNIGFVTQEPVLFSCSVRDNILYGSNDPSTVTEEQLHAVAKEANCLQFILRDFPDGFDTLVGERGVMLSGGQKQRIAIARALIKNPKILVLDEATSALDAESEHLVQEALERIMKGRTVLTIAHRLSTIKNADQIAVLDKGRIIEKGSYGQLIGIEGGAFVKLIRHQAFL